MMQKTIVSADHISVNANQRNIIEDLSFDVHLGEAWAIVGPSGSGKTILGKVIGGLYPISSGQLNYHLPEFFTCIFISQQHDFRNLSSSRSYYQQRFDSNYGEESPIVEEVLLKYGNHSEILKMAELLQVKHILKSRLIELSNGEGKRIQLVQALLQNPQMVVLDNPFIGLDNQTRKILHEIINHLIESGIILFVITSPDEIPEKITQVLELEAGKIKKIHTRSEFKASNEITDAVDVVDLASFAEIIEPLKNDFSVAVDMRQVTVRYGEKVILEDINWKIKKGEKWALLGHNGSGKSTLLSLINGDNPQAYSNEIYLFDQKRGSGESIWDIKSKIGYISPELHIYFQRDFSYTEALTLASGKYKQGGYSQPGTTCFEAVASGFNDQIGSSQTVSEMQTRKVLRWMDFLKITSLKNQPLYQASLGEQRLVLLARALVRNPAMLILDEPCQGLDKKQTINFTKIVDSVCHFFDKTLIYVSHYPEEIPACVDKILILEKGKTKELINKR